WTICWKASASSYGESQLRRNSSFSREREYATALRLEVRPSTKPLGVGHREADELPIRNTGAADATMSDFAGNEELLQDFLTEANELLADLDNRLVDLEKSPGEAALLNAVF